MADGTNNAPAAQRQRRFMKKLVAGAKAGISGFTVPYRDTTPDPSSGINMWISWANGQLYFRSPDGFVQGPLGVAGHGGAGAIEGAVTYETAQVTLDPTDAETYPARGDASLGYGPSIYSAIRFVMPALTPVGAEILRVELYLHPLDLPNETAEVFVAGDGMLSSPLPGSYSSTPAPQTVVLCKNQRPEWHDIDRLFGENFRDGIWNSIILTPDFLNSELAGVVAGIGDSGEPPQLRVTYASEV